MPFPDRGFQSVMFQRKEAEAHIYRAPAVCTHSAASFSPLDLCVRPPRTAQPGEGGRTVKQLGLRSQTALG